MHPPHFLIINLSKQSSQQPIYRSLHQTTHRSVLLFKQRKNKADTSSLSSPLSERWWRKASVHYWALKGNGVDRGDVMWYFQTMMFFSHLLLLFYLFSASPCTILSISLFFMLHPLPQTTDCSSAPHHSHCDELIAVSSSECDGSPVLWSINRLFKTLQRDKRTEKYRDLHSLALCFWLLEDVMGCKRTQY